MISVVSGWGMGSNRLQGESGHFSQKAIFKVHLAVIFDFRSVYDFNTLIYLYWDFCIFPIVYNIFEYCKFMIYYYLVFYYIYIYTCIIDIITKKTIISLVCIIDGSN